MTQLLTGKHTIEEALNSETAIDRVIISHNKKKTPGIQHLIQECRRKGVKVQTLSAQQLQDTYPEAGDYGIVAICQSIGFTDLNELSPETDPFLLIVDHLEDPYNFGALLRSAELFGVTAVIFPKDRNCQLTPGVIKASSGAISHLKMVRVTNISKSIDSLKDKGYWIYGADANQGEALQNARVNFPAAVVAGNESKGLSRLVSKSCDVHLKIPTVGKTDSLNVSVAMGIIMHHFSIQDR